MVSFTPPICSGGWLRKRLRKWSASCRRRSVVCGGKVAQRLLHVPLVEEQVIDVFQRHVRADLVEHFQRGGDVRLRLVLKKALVARWPRLDAVSTTNLA